MIGTGINPSGSYRIYTRYARQTNGQSMSQRCNSSFSGCITLRIRLRLKSTRRRNVYNRSHPLEMVFEQPGQHIRCHYPHTLHIQKTFIITVRKDTSPHQASIINQAMYTFWMFTKHQSCKFLQSLFLCHIADKSGHLPASLTHLFHLCESGLLILVYKIYTIPLRSKMCDDATSDTSSSPRHYYNSIHNTVDSCLYLKFSLTKVKIYR